MNLIFQQLHIENFLSIDTTDIDLTNQGFVSIVGQNENTADLAKSNGSGKSSIWEALVWVLTGNTIRGTKDVVRHNSDNGALVSLDFKCDSNQFKIIRTKNHDKYKTNFKIIINGQDKSGKGIRDGEKLFSDCLPDLTSDLINSIIVLGQGLPLRFSNNTPSGRKELLEKFSKSDYMILHIAGKVSKRNTELQTAQRKLQDERLQATTLLDNLTQRKAKLQSEIDRLQQEPLVQDEILRIESEIKAVGTDISEKQERASQAKFALDKGTSEIQVHNQAHTSNIQEYTSTKYSETAKAHAEIAQLQSEITRNKTEISKLNKLGAVCPTCGQPIQRDVKQDVENFNEQINVLTRQIGEKQAQINGIEKQYNDLISKEQSQIIPLQKLSELSTTYNKAQTEYNNANNKRVSLHAQLLSLQTKQAQYQINLQKYQQEIADIDKQCEELTSKTLYNKEKEQGIETRLAILAKMLNAVRKDFRGVLLQNVIKYIDEVAKGYCNIVFGHTDIYFELSDNNLVIKYQDREYESLSGGERQKIDVILQLSLRKMLCELFNFSSNIIVMDEIFDNLDMTGCQKIIDIITQTLTDIDSVYIITHHNDLQIPYDKEIIVTKDNNGNSHIKV